MDTDPVSFKEFDDYLRDLERINVVLTLAYRPTLLWLKRAIAEFSSRAADIGYRRRQRRWRHVAAVEEMGAREEFEARSDRSWCQPLVDKIYYALPKEIDPQPDSTFGS